MSINNTHNKQKLDPSKLQFSYFNPSIDDFSKLDFTKDNLDPLEVDKFIHNDPFEYVNNHVSKIYSVTYDGKLVGFFTLSMSHIKMKDLNSDDQLNQITFTDYPSLLLGQMGVEKNSRGLDIGVYIIKFCRGIGQLINEKIACAFLILRTTNTLAEKYYECYCDLQWIKSNKPKVWMYKKLF